MADSIVLINGVPGSGKTTLAAPLAGVLGATSLSKDAVKEALAAVTDPSLHRALGAIAMDTVWQLASRVEGLVVVDSWWFRPRDLPFARSGLQVARPKRAVEVWCDVPIEVARVRYERRVRNTVHDDARDMSHEWSAWQAEGRPLAIGPIEIVDTTSAIDVSALAARITRTLEPPCRSGHAR